MSARKPELTALQRHRVERAREVAAADAETLATAYDHIDPDNLVQVHAYALGVTRATVTTLLEIIGGLTGGALDPPQEVLDRMAARGLRELTGPFETQREALDLPAVQAIYEAFRADPGAGRMAPGVQRMLEEACAAAGVGLGAYDRRVLAWLAGWEPQVCAVIAGLISRAHDAGAAR